MSEAAPASSGLAPRPASPSDLEHWDRRMVHGPGGHVYQSRAWARHCETRGWRSRFVMLDDDLGAVVLVRPTPWIGGGSAYVTRGPIVDQEALLGALDSGHLAGAGLDVVEREPLDDDRLRHHPRVVLTPHVAFYSVEGFLEMRRKSAEEVRRLLLGQPTRCPVNRVPPAGAR